MLRSDSEANEVVQEAFIKFILAAPELDTKERALAYMRATINNLSLNVIRARGSRPNLVALDSDTSAERLAEIAVENYIPADVSISAAEDAAIIKLALAQLSPAERAALVMWEMEGRSTSEIASELGITAAQVAGIDQMSRSSQISSNGADTLIGLCCENPAADPLALAQQNGLLQVSDESSLDAWVDEAIAANPKSVESVKAGKEAAIGAIVGAVMKLSKGKANPKIIGDKLRAKLLG
jgi:RNA polymerase sigma factor (sigma-70 family)